MIDALGNTTSWSYDANSNNTGITELDVSAVSGVPPELYVTTYGYDGIDRLTSHLDNAGHLEQFRYDSRNNLLVTVDGRGNVTRGTFDGLDRLTRTQQLVTDTGLGTGTLIDTLTQVFSHDASHRLVSSTDANGHPTQYQYDELGRLIATLHADGSLGTVSYDVQDNVIATTDPNGTVVTYVHDLNDREIQRTIAAGGGVAATTSFEVRSYDGRSLLRNAANDDSGHAFAYDSLANPVEEVLNGATLARSYDGVGNKRSLGYPGGRQITFEYDALDRLAAVMDATSTLPVLLDSYEYIGSRVLRRDCATGTRLTLEYDADRRVTRTRHVRNPGLPTAQVIDDRTYAWDATDNKVALGEITPQGVPRSRVMSYDSVGRLTATLVTELGGTVRNTVYSYDAAGNRTQVVDGECSGSYFLDATSPQPADAQMNQYSSTGCDLRTYDENGNLTGASPMAGSGLLLTFDYLDRLVAATDQGTGTTHEYRYTATGLRWKKQVGGVAGSIETRHFHDGDRLIEVQDPAGATLRTYVYGATPREVLNLQELTGGPTDSYFRADDLGSVVVLCDGAGLPVERYQYDDFGSLSMFDAAGTPLPASGTGNVIHYTGLEFDPETRFLHALGHCYDPLVGRGVQRRWGLGGSLGGSLEVDVAHLALGAGSNPYSGWNDLRLTPFGAGGPTPAALPTGKRQHKPVVISMAAGSSGRAHRAVRADYCGDGTPNPPDPGMDLVWDPIVGPMPSAATGKPTYGPVISIKPKGFVRGGVVVASGDINGAQSPTAEGQSGTPLPSKRQHKPFAFPKEHGAAASSLPWPSSVTGDEHGAATPAAHHQPILINKRIDTATATAHRPILINKRIDPSATQNAPAARPKYSNITLKRGFAEAGTGASQVPNLVLKRGATAAAKPGRTKYANITLERGLMD